MNIKNQIVAVDDKVDVKQTLEAFVPKNIEEMVMMLNLMQFQPKGRNSFHLKNALERLLPDSDIKFTNRYSEKVIEITSSEKVKWRGIEFRIIRKQIITHETSWGIVKYAINKKEENNIEALDLQMNTRIDRAIKDEELVGMTQVQIIERTIEYYVRGLLSHKVHRDYFVVGPTYKTIFTDPRLKTFVNKVARKTFKEVLAEIK